MCVRQPGIELEPQLGVRAAAEVDRRARERVVHRHDRVAVARDPAPVAERARRAPRRARAPRPRPCGGRPVSRSPAPSSTRSKPGVERELLEEVVVEAGAGRDAHAARAVEREPRREARLGRRAQRPRTPTAARRDRRRPVEQPRERLDEQVVVRRVAHRDADRLGVGAHDDALAQQRVAERRGRRRPGRRGSSRATRAARGRARAAPRRAARAPRSPAPRRAARRAPRPRAPPRAVETGPAPGGRSARAATSRATRARSRRARRRAPNSFENVRRTITPSSSRASAVSPLYSKYASSTTSGRASGSGAELAGRVVRAAGEREHGVVVADLGARRAARRSGRADRSAPPGSRSCRPGPAYARAQSRIRSSAPAPRTTFSGSTPA